MITRILFAFFAITQSAQALDGLYLRVVFAFRQYNQENWWFLPDGRYMSSVPANGGLTSAGWNESCAKPSAECGHYTVTGDKLNLTPSAGKATTMSIVPKPGGFDLDGIFASKVSTLPASAKLNGTYSGSIGNNAASAAHGYTFRPDGTYQSDSVGSVRGGFGSAGSSSQQSGTYKASGNTLELTTGGKTTRHVIYPYDMGGGDVRMSIDGMMMKQNK